MSCVVSSDLVLGSFFVVYDAGEDGGNGVGGFNLDSGRSWLSPWPAVCLADVAWVLLGDEGKGGDGGG